MFGIYEGGEPSSELSFCDRMQGERGLAARFWPEDLHDAAARISADAECAIEREAPGRDGIDRPCSLFIEHPDAFIAKFFLHAAHDLVQRIGRWLLVFGHVDSPRQCCS